MAKRRKKHRRHHMGAVTRSSKMNLSTDLGAALGGGIGGFVDKVIPTTINPKLVAGAKIVLGGVVRRTWSGPMGNAIGLGITALGTYQLLAQFGLLSGLGQSDDMVAVSLDGIGADVLAGDDVAVVNGADDVSVVNGMGADVLAGEDDYMGADDLETF
jgi:hypothetical protein